MGARDARRLAVVAGAFPALDTAVNVAFPAIDEHFELAVADLQWIVVTYLFTYAALLVPAGWLGDRIGHRQLVLAGALVSVVGVAGCAASPTWALFLVARVVQGAGTAMLYAGSPALLTTSADDDARATAVSWFQAASMIGLTIGPLIGGPLVEAFGWRSVYAFRIPIAAALGLLALRGRSASTSTVNGAAVGRPDNPWAPLRNRDVRRANVVNALANAAMFPTWLLVPSLLVDELSVAVVAAGIVLAASPACSAIGSLWVGGQLSERDPTTMARLGLGLLIAGLALLALLGPTAGVVAIVIGVALVGAGIGIFAVPNMHVVMASLPLDRQGVAGGISVMTRTMGVVFGVLAAGAAFDTIEAERGFDTGFRVIFAVAATVGLAALAITRRD